MQSQHPSRIDIKMHKVPANRSMTIQSIQITQKLSQSSSPGDGGSAIATTAAAEGEEKSEEGSDMEINAVECKTQLVCWAAPLDKLNQHPSPAVDV